MNPEHLKCPVCIEIFDGNVFILKCGHNFCSTCLPKLPQSARVNQVRDFFRLNTLVVKYKSLTTIKMFFTQSKNPM